MTQLLRSPMICPRPNLSTRKQQLGDSVCPPEKKQKQYKKKVKVNLRLKFSDQLRWADTQHSFFPDHMVYLILLWLPLSSLLRFRYLCKLWNEIIESRFFSMHLIQMQPIKEQLLITSIIFSMPNFVQNKWLTLVKFRSEDGELHQDTVSRLKFHDIMDDIWMSTCSCDGLLCSIYESSNYQRTVIVIWNPFTRQYKKVEWPKDVLERYYGVSTFVGFGYDRTISDYKIVVVSFTTYDPEKICMIKVRALKSNEWKTVDSSAIPCNLMRGYDMLEPIGVGEDVYWTGINRDDKSPCIMKFNLIEEKLTMVSLPRMKTETCKKFLVKLGHFDRSLYGYVYGFYCEALVEVWKHSKQGNNDIWERVLTISKESVPQDIKSKLLKPLGFARNGSFLMVSHGDNIIQAYVPQQDIFLKIKMDESIIPKESNYSQVHLLDTVTLISP